MRHSWMQSSWFGQCRHCWASSNHSWGKTKQAARHCMQLYSLNNCKKCSKFCCLQYHPLLDHSFSAKRYQLISFLCWNSHWLSILLHSFGSKGTEDQLQPFQLRAVFTHGKCALACALSFTSNEEIKYDHHCDAKILGWFCSLDLVASRKVLIEMIFHHTPLDCTKSRSNWKD